MTQSFSEKLKKLRREYGLSQDELGLKAGVHGRHIGKYEIGRAMPNAATIVKLAEALNVSTDYLLKDESGQPEIKPQPVSADEALLHQLQDVARLPEQDRIVVTTLIDAFIKKQKIELVLQG